MPEREVKRFAFRDGNRDGYESRAQRIAVRRSACFSNRFRVDRDVRRFSRTGNDTFEALHRIDDGVRPLPNAWWARRWRNVLHQRREFELHVDLSQPSRVRWPNAE